MSLFTERKIVMEQLTDVLQHFGEGLITADEAVLKLQHLIAEEKIPQTTGYACIRAIREEEEESHAVL